jgi:polyhydroxybutyrate depolymerase
MRLQMKPGNHTWLGFLSGAILVLIAAAAVPVVAIAADQSPTAPIAPWDREENVWLGNFNRHFIVHVPPTFEAKRKLPVVIMLHDVGGTGQQAMEQTGWDHKADHENFIAVFPDGVAEHPKVPASFLLNPESWNEGSGLHASGKRADGDVEFIAYIIDTVESRYGADPNRIFVTGFSNGASMTFRAGAELSNKVAAIAAVAGHVFVHDRDLKRPLPTLYIIGRNDPIELPGGGVLRIRGEKIAQPPLEQNLAQWRQLEGCPLAPSSGASSGGVERISFTGCRDGAEVVEYFIDGMGHVWPGGVNRLPEREVGKSSDKLNATDVIWKFFKAHPRKQ